MDTPIKRLGEAMRHIRAKSLAFAFLVLVITAAIAIFAGVKIHAMTKETLLLRGELNSQEAAMEYDRYLLTRVDIVTMVGNTVDNLLESDADAAAIEKYLTDETNNVTATLDPMTTGLYGLFGGVYVDGSGWVPDAGYDPLERPWYIQTMESDKGVTLVDPYLDAQTNTIMMTVSKLLSDGQSVLAMDVSLAPIQEIVKEVSTSTEGGQAFLLSADGIVIAHSDESQLGKNYMEEPDSLGGVVAHRLLVGGEKQFEVDMPEGNFEVYVNDLEGGWYSVSLINGGIWHRPLHLAMLVYSVIFALVILSIITVFLHLAAKNAALEELHMRVDQEERRRDELQALSETDRMTGLNDRVSGERKVNENLESGSGGTFLELDIDKFKSINDTYGHQTGDMVILAVADALRSMFRTNDVTIRLGGDEFGVFAVGVVSQELGETLVGRLFRQIDMLDIPELQGEKVSVSAGAVLCPADRKSSFRELYAVADEALYLSKNTPGNSLTFGEMGPAQKRAAGESLRGEGAS